MNDQQQSPSGSRWEPTSPPPVHPPVNPEPYVGPPPPPIRSRWARSRGVVAGAGIGLLAASAFGGFALGHVNAAPDEGGRTGQVDTRFTDRGGLPAQPPAGDDDGDGQQPGQGVPGGSGEGTDTAYLR